MRFSTPSNFVILDSLRFNQQRLFKLAMSSTFALLVLALIGVLPGAQLLAMLPVGVTGKTAFGVLFIVCLAISFVFYICVALITQLVLRLSIRAAEKDFDNGDYKSALLKYKRCQRLTYLTLAENSNIAYELQHRVQQISSMPLSSTHNRIQ